jgi:hypothetical protein
LLSRVVEGFIDLAVSWWFAAADETAQHNAQYSAYDSVYDVRAVRVQECVLAGLVRRAEIVRVMATLCLVRVV